jgi:hypothetical protein
MGNFDKDAGATNRHADAREDSRLQQFHRQKHETLGHVSLVQGEGYHTEVRQVQTWQTKAEASTSTDDAAGRGEVPVQLGQDCWF